VLRDFDANDLSSLSDDCLRMLLSELGYLETYFKKIIGFGDAVSLSPVDDQSL